MSYYHRAAHVCDFDSHCDMCIPVCPRCLVPVDYLGRPLYEDDKEFCTCAKKQNLGDVSVGVSSTPPPEDPVDTSDDSSDGLSDLFPPAANKSFVAEVGNESEEECVMLTPPRSQDQSFVAEVVNESDDDCVIISPPRSQDQNNPSSSPDDSSDGLSVSGVDDRPSPDDEVIVLSSDTE